MSTSKEQLREQIDNAFELLEAYALHDNIPDGSMTDMFRVTRIGLERVKDNLGQLITQYGLSERLEEVGNIPPNPYLDDEGQLIYKKNRIAELNQKKGQL